MSFQLILTALIVLVGAFQAFIALQQRKTSEKEKEVLNKLQEVSEKQAAILERSSEPPEFNMSLDEKDEVLEIKVENSGNGSATNFSIIDFVLVDENKELLDFEYIGDYQLEKVEYSFTPGDTINLTVKGVEWDEIKGIVVWLRYERLKGHMILTYPPDLNESFFEETGIPHPKNPKKYKILDDPFDLRED
jgi:hypothetical protein